MSANSSPQIILAGFGAPDSLHVTLEAHQAAARAGRIFALGLGGRLRTILNRQGIEIDDLDHLMNDAPFADAYARIGALVLDRAEHDPPAMFLSQGNPLLLNSVGRYVHVEAGKRGLSIVVYPGVSTIDQAVADLGIDVGRVGLLTISARGIVARPAVLNPNAPLLVLQVAGLVGDGGMPSGYDALARTLAAVYPVAQPVTVLNASRGGAVSRATVTLERFDQLVQHFDASSSLFIDIALRPPAPAQSPGS